MPRELIPPERIINKIYLIRNKKVMFDFDLAELYGVETKYLKRQVKRNIERFPEDFIFSLTAQEFNLWEEKILRCQNVTSSLKSQIATSNWGGRRYLPYVFTEQGVAMLSSVLKSGRAVQVNIIIMRTFTKLREILLTHKELREKIEEMEKKYDQQFRIVFEAIKNLLDKKKEPIREIGFKS